MSALTKRYVGLDVHKHYVMIAAVNAAHEVVLRPQRVNLTTCLGQEAPATQR